MNPARRGGDHRPDHALEELTANAAGDALSDPEFLERLAQQAPGIFRRFARRLPAYLDRFPGKVRDLASNRYLSDVATFRDKLADVLMRHAELRDAADLLITHVLHPYLRTSRQHAVSHSFVIPGPASAASTLEPGIQL